MCLVLAGRSCGRRYALVIHGQGRSRQGWISIIVRGRFLLDKSGAFEAHRSFGKLALALIYLMDVSSLTIF